MTPTRAVKNNRDLDPLKFLATVGEGRKVVAFLKKQAIFTQGDAAGPVFYIREGKVRHSVVSKLGKDATLGIWSKGAFFGDDGLAGPSLRTGSVTAMTDCTLLQIDKEAMMLALQGERAFSDIYISYLLARNIRYQEDFVDQIFGSSEKRLARVLLLQAHFGEEDAPETVITKVSHETLADMTGTTRTRVRSVMKRFRKLGFLANRRSGLQVHSSLLRVVLDD